MLLAQVPPEESNVILVSHSGNLERVLPITHLPEGLMVVFKPDGNGSFQFMGKMTPDELFRIY